MSNYTINLQALLFEAFGQHYVINPVHASDAAGDSQGGMLGLPLYESVTFKDLLNGNELDIGDTIVECTLERTIMREQPAGRIGSIKEYVSTGDYVISIRGFLASNNTWKAPYEQIAQFNSFFNQPRAIGITGDIFRVLGIHNIVIEKANIGKMPGYINIRPFEILAYSDDEYQIMLEKDAGNA